MSWMSRDFSSKTLIGVGIGTSLGVVACMMLYPTRGGLSALFIPAGALLGGLVGKAVNSIYEKYSTPQHLNMGLIAARPEPSTARDSVSSYRP